MNNNRYKITGITRAITMVVAILFIVFGSCPVKKFIRLELNKQTGPLTETPNPQTSINYNVKNVSDCSLADRHEERQTIVYDLVKRLAGVHDFTPFFYSAVLSLAVLVFFRKNERTYVLSKAPAGPPPMVPLFLQIRHLQI